MGGPVGPECRNMEVAEFISWANEDVVVTRSASDVVAQNVVLINNANVLLS